jgi:hypothetical protein
MSVALHHEVDGKVLNVRVSGKLTKADYEQFVPEFEKAISEHGKIRVLFEMVDFHGWSAAALWEDVKLLKHFGDVERIAMVGDKAWQKGMSIFCKPFTKAEVRYFEHPDIDRAREWVSEGIAEEAKKG